METAFKMSKNSRKKYNHMASFSMCRVTPSLQNPEIPNWFEKTVQAHAPKSGWTVLASPLQQLCFDVKLQKCFVEYETSPDFPWSWRLLAIESISILGWTNPLIASSQHCTWGPLPSLWIKFRNIVVCMNLWSVWALAFFYPLLPLVLADLD